MKGVVARSAGRRFFTSPQDAREHRAENQPCNQATDVRGIVHAKRDCSKEQIVENEHSNALQPSLRKLGADRRFLQQEE